MAKKKRKFTKRKFKTILLSIIFIFSIIIGFIFNSNNSIKLWFDSELQNALATIENIKVALKIDNLAETSNDETDNLAFTVDSEITSLSTENLEIFYFDVGQADCILVANNGYTMLIDAGNNEDGELICKYLKNLDIYKIDFLIGTHPHEDHIGGLDDIINNFEIENVFMSNVITNTKSYEDVLNALISKNLSITPLEKNNKFYLGEACCTVKSAENTPLELNDSSIVIQLDYKNEKYLFMGDATTQVENNTTWEKVNVIKLGHHGSSTSTGNTFLEQTQPEIAIISVGKDNSYGHPSVKILNRLKNFNVQVYRTDTDGTIYLMSDGFSNNIHKLDVCLDGN